MGDALLFLVVPGGAAPGVPESPNADGDGKTEVGMVIEREAEGFDKPVSEGVDVGEEGPAPDPPAVVDSCAKPMDGGLERYTEYTFF